MEGDTVVAVTARARLADVVQERTEPYLQIRTRLGHDGDRVREHVLVSVDRVLLEPHRIQLGQELVGEAGVGDQPESRRRVVGQQQLRQLVADALRADDRQPTSHGGDRLNHRGIGLEREGGHEPRGAQHAQRIIAERQLRTLRRAQALLGEVGETPERVDQFGLVERERHRVDCEVAARQVGLDVVGVGDLGLAALGVVHVGAERRDLERLAALLQADGAEALALQPDRVSPVAHDRLDGFGPRVGSDVDVVLGTQPVEEHIAHDPADEVRAVTSGLEPARERLGRGVGFQEGCEARRNRHVRILSGRALVSWYRLARTWNPRLGAGSGWRRPSSSRSARSPSRARSS